MKRFMAIAAALTLVSAMSASAASFSWTENFESGLSAWTASTGSAPPVLSTDQSVSPTHSVFVPAQSANSMGYLWHAVANAEKDFDLTWSFFDTAAATGQRNYIQVVSYAEGGNAGTLSQLFALGTYNSGVLTNEYNARIVNGGTAPATAWFSSGIARSVGWHTARIKQGGDGKLQMWIDGNQFVNITLTAGIAPVTSIRIGSNLSNAGTGMYFDNITFVTPEPGSMVALGAGLLSMVGLIRRKK